jgi:hypothetical protein
MQDQTMWFGWYLMLIGLPFVVRILTVKELPIRRGRPPAQRQKRQKKGA